MRQTCLSLLFAAALAFLTVPAQAACRVVPQSAAPVEIVRNTPLTTVQVNDVDATFIVDTGAYRTLMGDDAVRNLKLERDQWVATAIRGIGGVQERPDALPRSLRLGTTTLHRRTLTGGASVMVGPLPVNAVDGRPITGLLGRDFLSPFDLDLDLSNGRLTLYDVQGCSAGFLPWTTPYAAIPAIPSMDSALVVQVVVDGRPLRALIDTGASGSLITASGMFRLSITPELLAGDLAGNGAGVGPAPVVMHRHHFAEMRVGPDATRDPTLWVAPVHMVPIVDMLLGADWLRSRRVWLSFATKQMFVAVR
jgi:hypothetical protein